MMANEVMMIEIHKITPAINLLNLAPPITGFQHFIGSYVLHGEKTGIIDTGPASAVPNLVAGLKTLGIRPQEIAYIFLTHVHIDHAGGIGAAVRELPNAAVIAHPRARKHLIDPTELWEASRKTLGELADDYGKIEAVPESRLTNAADGMTVELGKRMKLEILLTPGHAPHHLSLFNRSDNIVFAGEAAGICLGGKILRSGTPPPFSLTDYLTSLDHLIALKPNKIAYGHFGCYDHATEKLETVKRQVMEWYRIVTMGKKAGKTTEEIFQLMRDHDPNLKYLNDLEPGDFAREYKFLINSIKGLAGPA